MTTLITDDLRSKLQMLTDIQFEVNRLPKDDIVNLKLSDFALVCRAMKSQSYGSLGERWVCQRLYLTRVTGNKYYDATDGYFKYEIKFTISSPGKKFNVVQIRPDADLDAYLIFGINSDNTGQIWHLSKQDMANEMVLLRARSAHGKFDSTTKEFRFSFAEGDATYKRWRKYQLTDPGW